MSGVTFREGIPHDAGVIIRNYFRMWHAMGIPEDELHSDRLLSVDL